MELHRSASSSNRGVSSQLSVLCRVLDTEDEDDEGLMRQLTRQGSSEKRRRRTVWFAGILIILGTASAVAVLCRGSLVHIVTRIGKLPRYQGGGCYAALVALWLLVLLPTSLLEVAGGFIFGFWLAALCSTIGKVTGSFISFGIGRKYKGFVQLQLMTEPQGYIAGLNLAMQQRPFSTCLALRLAYLPEAVQNFTPAMLDTPFLPFAGATVLGGGIYACLWAKLGASLHHVKDIIKDGMSTEKLIFILCGAFSLFLFLFLIHLNTSRLIRQLSNNNNAAQHHSSTVGRLSLGRNHTTDDDLDMNAQAQDPAELSSSRRNTNSRKASLSRHFPLQQHENQVNDLLEDDHQYDFATNSRHYHHFRGRSGRDDHLPAHHPPMNPGASLSDAAASLV